MIDFIRPYLSRIIAGGVTALTAFLASKLGVVLSPDDQATLTQGGVVLLIALTQPLYGLVHKFLDRWINPTDAADPVVAEAGVRSTRALRRGMERPLPPAAAKGTDPDYTSRR